jgi:hypothetical protein
LHCCRSGNELDDSAELDDSSELLLDSSLDEDFAEDELDLADDFAELQDLALEDDSFEGLIKKSLSSSPQATSIAAQRKAPSQRERIIPPIIRDKYNILRFRNVKKRT